MFIPGAEQSGQPSLKPEPLAGLGLQAGMRKSVQKRSRAVLSGFFSTYAAVSGSPQGISGLRFAACSPDSVSGLFRGSMHSIMSHGSPLPVPRRDLLIQETETLVEAACVSASPEALHAEAS